MLVYGLDLSFFPVFMCPDFKLQIGKVSKYCKFFCSDSLVSELARQDAKAVVTFLSFRHDGPAGV